MICAACFATSGFCRCPAFARKRGVVQAIAATLCLVSGRGGRVEHAARMSVQTFSWARAFVRPGAVVFATLFALDSMARSLLSNVVTLQAHRVLPNDRDVSLLFTCVGWAGIAATLFVSALVRQFRPRWMYTIAAGMLCAAPMLLALGNLAGLVSGMLTRTFAAACLLNLLNLYIMAYIRKKDLARSEPLRTFFSAGAWTAGPLLGVLLFNQVSPMATFGLSAFSAVLLLVYFWWVRLEYGPALGPDEPVTTNPLPHIRRYLAQPRLVLAWLLNFGRETWWVTFFIYGFLYMLRIDDSGDIGALLISCGTALLFVTPAAGWLARRFGMRRHLAAGYVLAGTAMLLAAAFFDRPWIVAGLLILGALGAVNLDAVGFVPFLRAVRGRERPEMTMVFSIYRDAAGLVPTAIYSLLLSFFELSSVFIAAGIGVLGCACLCRYIPRGM